MRVNYIAKYLFVVSKVCDDGLLVVSQHALSFPECLQTDYALVVIGSFLSE